MLIQQSRRKYIERKIDSLESVFDYLETSFLLLLLLLLVLLCAGWDIWHHSVLSMSFMLNQFTRRRFHSIHKISNNAEIVVDIENSQLNCIAVTFLSYSNQWNLLIEYTRPRFPIVFIDKRF